MIIENRITDTHPALVEEAVLTLAAYQNQVEALMTDDRTRLVRLLRIEEGPSWQRGAQICHRQWSGEWSPPGDQLMGVALCRVAAAAFGEHYLEAPWH